MSLHRRITHYEKELRSEIDPSFRDEKTKIIFVFILTSDKHRRPFTTDRLNFTVKLSSCLQTACVPVDSFSPNRPELSSPPRTLNRRSVYVERSRFTAILYACRPYMQYARFYGRIFPVTFQPRRRPGGFNIENKQVALSSVPITV